MKTYIPRSVASAQRHIKTALQFAPAKLPRRLFLRAWCSIFWLHPGLYPDGFGSRDSGWPRKLQPLAREAFRRRLGGTISDSELYPYQAAKARLLRSRQPSPSVT